jgi:hypothetical protein
MSTLARVIYDPDATPPTTPSTVVATALSSTAIRITWVASTDTGGSGLSGYRVYRATASGGPYSQVGADLSAASLSYDDTSLGASQTRYYRVAAFDGNANVSSQSLVASATTQAGSGSTIYNGLTPTVYAAPSAVGSGSGANEANAMAYSTWQNASGNKPAGTVLGLLPGVYSMPTGGERFEPAFRTRASGTSGNPIRIVAKYSAIDLAGKAAGASWTTSDLATVFAHANRTEFRHTGTWTAPNGGSTSGPSFGCGLGASENYVEWNGICADEQHNIPHRDTGAAVLFGCTGSAVKRCVIYGRNSWYTTETSDNHPGVRVEGATSCTVSDNVIYGFRNSGGPGGTTNGSHNHSGIQRYESIGTIVENNYTFGCHTGIYLKDQDIARDEIVRRNICKDVECGIEILNTNESTSTTDEVYQNLIHGPLECLILQAEGRNINVYNNTFVGPMTSAGSAAGVVAHFADTGCSIRNNIFYGTSGSMFIDEQFRSAAVIPSNYNLFYRSGTQFTCRYNGVTSSSLATWRSNTGQDLNSLVSDPLFTDAANGDFSLTVSSPGRTLSDIGGQVGAYESSLGPRYA